MTVSTFTIDRYIHILQTVHRVWWVVSSNNGGRKKMRARYLTSGCGDEVQTQEQGEGMMGGEIVKVVKVAMSQDIEDKSQGQEQQPHPPPSEEDVNTSCMYVLLPLKLSVDKSSRPYDLKKHVCLCIK